MMHMCEHQSLIMHSGVQIMEEEAKGLESGEQEKDSAVNGAKKETAPEPEELSKVYYYVPVYMQEVIREWYEW